MKQYIVLLDTILKGRPVYEKDVVSLSDEDAKGYRDAGLIVEAKVAELVKSVTAPASDKKAGK
ncbi:hypothetical protein [Ochrobactrum sp. A-1]|uniref:hypothetical protein n=1 Tax=Ochrobactrum sp. A-1 TaxID=2920940 RepID=UPI001F0A484E|nr:hypothetical protein [Ochrobactrum sp. A-1]